MYVVGGEALLPSSESLAIEPAVEEDAAGGGKDATDGPKVDYHPVLLLFRSSIQDGGYTSCSKEIQIGVCACEMCVDRNYIRRYLCI